MIEGQGDSRRFPLLVASMFLVQLGIAVTNIALPLLVLERYGISGELGLILALRVIPMFLVGGAASVALRKWDARIIAVPSIALTGLATMAIIFATDFWQLAVVVCLGGAVSVFSTPALMVLRSGVIPDDKAVRLNGLVVASERVPEVLGPAISVAVLVFGSVEILLFAEGAACLLAAALVLGLPRVAPSIDPEEPAPRLLSVLNVPQLWRSAGRTARMRGYLVTGFFYTAAVSVGRVLLASLAVTVFADNSSAFAWLLGSMALGAVLGGLVGGSMRAKWLGAVYLVGNVAEAVLWVIVGVGGPLPIVCTVLFIAGVLESVATTAFFADIQLRLSPAAVGELFALFVPLTSGAAVAGSLLASGVVPATAAWVSALIVAVLIAVPFTPYLRTYLRAEDPALRHESADALQGKGAND